MLMRIVGCRYAFATPSTLKPTQWHYPSGSINQIPGTATICGDMRVTPFYDVEEVSTELWLHYSDRTLAAEPHARLCSSTNKFSRECCS